MAASVPHLSTEAIEALSNVFERARAIGLLGQGEVGVHIDHALGFVRAASSQPTQLVDLGSGAGVPGLVLAGVWADAHLTLVDAMERRTTFLQSAVAELKLQGRVTVLRGRAEDLARDESHRGRYDMVTARSFGAPAVAAECATGFLGVGGYLLVSEPPDVTDRWSAEGLASLGLRQSTSGDDSIAVLEKFSPTEDRFPRRVGVPTKRPLW